MQLLEREDLLDRLDDLRREGGRLVFVGGEAGVGKTSLVRALAQRVGDVRHGSCENLGAPTPLGPFLDLGLESGDPRAVAAATLARGGTVVLEDVHWADGASLDVLRVLGRRVDGSDTFVVATYRDDEVAGGHPLRVVLGELASARGVVRLSVPRLSLEAVRELAAPAHADAESIHRLTLGNAFYVTEILASGAEELPATVRDAVLARAALLEEPARRLLEAISVVPRRA
jgi:predicted ATPase